MFNTYVHSYNDIMTISYIIALLNKRSVTSMYFYRVDERLSIKVADFGLARDVYSTEYYRVEQHVVLPVKWMSLESLMDGYFDEKTDVVSYLSKCYNSAIFDGAKY